VNDDPPKVGENIDHATVKGLGADLLPYNQSGLEQAKYHSLKNAYLHIFPRNSLPADCKGYVFQCGSGRGTARVIDRIGILRCIDRYPLRLTTRARISAIRSASRATFSILQKRW
jgi:hypothetical protein